MRKCIYITILRIIVTLCIKYYTYDLRQEEVQILHSLLTIVVTILRIRYLRRQFLVFFGNRYM